jgi:hypothetical protein
VNLEEAPDYHKVIARPMDLRTLQDRLASGLITTVSQFKRELDLVWDNCISYNKIGHPLANIAIETRRAVNAVWKESVQPPKSHGLEKIERVRDLLDEMREAAVQVLPMEPRPVIPPLKIPKYVPRPVPPPVAPPAKVEVVVPNRKQQKEIAERLSHSPVSEMQRAWDLLQPHLERGATSFSLNQLPDPVLIELKQLVLS